MSSTNTGDTQSPTNHQQVVLRYRKLLEEQTQIVARCNQSWSTAAWARGGLFLAFVVALFLAVNNAFEQSTLLYAVSALLFVTFTAFALYVERLEAALKHSRLQASIHFESIARCQREWRDIKVPQVEVPAELAAVSQDLDLFTDSSIFKLLGITRTPLGTETLTSWIRQGAQPEEVAIRQQAVKELAPMLKWREDFQLLCAKLSSSQANPKRLVQWAQSPSWFERRRWLVYLTRVTSVASLAFIACMLFQLLPFGIAIPLLLGVMAVNFILSVIFSGSIHDQFNAISTQANEASGYTELFDRVAACDVSAPRLVELQSGFRSSGDGAQEKIGKLGWWISLANIRRGTLFLLYLVLEFLFFWDVHVLVGLEKWKNAHGHQMHGWFEKLGHWESLCALAKLAADEPTWAWPNVKAPADDSSAVVSATQLAHPLLGTERVANDAQVGPPGTVLLVTGSNMSGKSTLLRSIGANIVLAQMGTVVCAESMSLPPMRIESSMRIADSLADGVSFFMAELKRLKQVVDIANDCAADPNTTLLFLLDEILQGTNSRERQIAVSRVVRRLIDSKAIGAISTHDLDLAKTNELASACQTVHFSEQFVSENGKEKMTFDYRMKQGVAKTTNALKLLELVGLGESPSD